MRTIIVGFGLMLAASNARAWCRGPPDPTVFCGLSSTAILATVTPGPAVNDGSITVVVRQLAGDAMAGVELGTTLTLRSLNTDVVGVTPAPIANMTNLFVLQNVGTWIVGAPVVDGRVGIADDNSSYAIEVNEALALATNPNEADCDQRATEVVQPSIYLGGCDDTVGCSSTTQSSALSWVAVLIVFSLGGRRR